MRTNSLDSVIGNSREIQTECKGPCPLGAICRAISGIFFFSFLLSLMRRQHMPQHAVAYRKTRCTQRLLSLSLSFSGHRRPKLWEMFWVKNIQAFQKAVVITTYHLKVFWRKWKGLFFVLFFLLLIAANLIQVGPTLNILSIRKIIVCFIQLLTSTYLCLHIFFYCKFTQFTNPYRGSCVQFF